MVCGHGHEKPIFSIMKDVWKFFFLSLVLLFCLSGCAFHRLTVQTQYLSHETLASYHVGTPDPHLENPIIGQRLLLQWFLTSQDMEGDELFLHLIVRFRNHEEKEIKIPITEKRGFYVYDLTDQDYFATGGVQTYLAEIRKGSCIIASWKHPLWVKLIFFE
jgi:hypothetical protein